MAHQQEKYLIRLTQIDLEHVKNVEKGHLDFRSPQGLGSASLLGLYGQNGSGKTALIEAIGLLKDIMSGASVSRSYKDFISQGNEYAQLCFGFEIQNEVYKFEVSYVFKIRHVRPTAEELKDQPDALSRVEIFDESFKYTSEGAAVQRVTEVINTAGAAPFGPTTKFVELVGSEDTAKMNLLVAKSLASKLSRSFIFSGEILKAISQEARRRRLSDPSRHLSQDVAYLLAALKFYAQTKLFVLDTSDLNLPSFNHLELYWENKELENYPPLSRAIISLDAPTIVKEEIVENLKSAIHGINVVLSQIIPGMEIGFVCSESRLMDDGSKGVSVELTSKREGREIPLRCESEGIKKIISVLQLAIFIFNRSDVTVAIDDMDAGIFEYLWGELLNIVSEQGKGQLIFTAHNLRVLESINKEFIAFTTTDKSNRYRRLKGVKVTNNLHDLYLRKILLGNGEENFCNATDNAEIAFAMRSSALTS